MASFTGRMKSYWALVCNDADRMSVSTKMILLIIFGMSLCFVLEKTQMSSGLLCREGCNVVLLLEFWVGNARCK